MRSDGAALTPSIFFPFFLEGHMIVCMMQTRTLYLSFATRLSKLTFVIFGLLV